MGHHRNFPTKFQKLIIRDILGYSDEEITNLSLVDYELALFYSIETYVRRDILFIMSQIYGDKKGKSGEDSLNLIFEQPEIEEWIKQQYEIEEM